MFIILQCFVFLQLCQFCVLQLYQRNANVWCDTYIIYIIRCTDDGRERRGIWLACSNINRIIHLPNLRNCDTTTVHCWLLLTNNTCMLIFQHFIHFKTLLLMYDIMLYLYLRVSFISAFTSSTITGVAVFRSARYTAF